ncbi:MAG: hypothetical protein IPH66_13985 [Crocinitomicaceae bacterium]|nr:hypothetical protein [Crocinitomicaceae bacterium]
MKKLVVIFLLFIALGSQSQTELVNYYNSYSEVLGGMEDGGVSRYELYYFSVHAKISLCDIYFNGDPLQLTKKDTLIIVVNSFTPYNQPDSSFFYDHPDHLPEKQKYRVYQNDHKFYVNVIHAGYWNYEVCYLFGKNKYNAKAKDSFDSGSQMAAP